MNIKNCKICLKPLEADKTSRRYHPECFKLYRREYQKKYQTAVKAVRFSVNVLKQEVEELTKKVEELKNK